MLGKGRAAALATCAVLALASAACSISRDGEVNPVRRAELERAVDEQLSLHPKHDQVRALLVHVAGEPVLERYRDTDASTYWNTDAVTTSVVSTLIGIALHDGLIGGIDQTVGELLPGHRQAMRPEVAGITLEELLTMRGSLAQSGVDSTLEHMEQREPVRSIGASAPLRRHTGFEWSDEAVHLLAAVLAEATGTTVLDYARAELFDPLGISTRPAFEERIPGGDEVDFLAADFAWVADAAGLHLGWGFLKLRPADLARFGQLMLDGGRWEGEQLVPAEWVARATAPQVPVTRGPAGDYGYHWWVGESDGRPTFLAWGFGGQLVQVVPDLELVVVAMTEFNLHGGDGAGVGPNTLTFLVSDVIAPAVAGWGVSALQQVRDPAQDRGDGTVALGGLAPEPVGGV